MANPEVLQDYSDSVKRIRKQCFEAGMTDAEFRSMYLESLDSFNSNNNIPVVFRNRRFLTKYWLILIGFATLTCVAYNFKTLYSCLVCNLQDYVYPGLRLLRKMSIPFISLFPVLSELYHESCLVQNPFFSVVDMDCWPCSSVSNVREVHNPRPVHHQQSAPFIYETDQQPISFKNLQDFFVNNKEGFKKENSKILVNNKHHILADEIFVEDGIKNNNFYFWRFNNMNVARLLRQIIRRPKVVPKFGQSTERFLIINPSQRPLQVPDTECHFSFLLSLSGTRTVNLVPAEECQFQCKTLKVELKDSYLLWYNWWYWRPMIQPSTGNSTLVAYVGSYC